jgi:rare lipoprotein A
LQHLFLKFTILVIIFFAFHASFAMQKPGVKKPHHRSASISKNNIKYGSASFYADKFIAHSTSNGEKYNHKKYTAACNIFPLGKWIKVTNLRNHKSVILKINDRLSRKSEHIVDVSQTAAKKLVFMSQGVAKVRVEML